MVREHLTRPELEAFLLAELSGEGASDHEAAAHCEECSQCAALVSAHRAAMREIQSLRHLTTNSEHPGCPPQAQLLNLAAGLANDAEAMQLLEHASQCRRCAQLFRQAQECMAAPSQSRESLDLKSSSPDWQRKMAEQMAGKPAETQPIVKPWRPRRRWWFYVPLAASAAAVLLVFVFRASLFRPNLPQLLADAYSQRRTLEPRIPGAAYADWHEERGANQESVVTQNPIDKPAAVVRALCHKAPESDDCLIYSAQVNLLAGGYRLALTALAQVKDQSESKNFLLVRAQAEFEKGEREGEARIYTSSYGHAIEDLSRVLNADPHDPVALFNRALAYERLRTFKEAAADWQELLKFEKDPGWAAEAQHHLDAIRKKENSRLEHLRLLYDPEQSYRELISAPGLDAIHSEAYFETAVEQWIPPATVSARVAHSALEKLATALQQNHHDTWLLDFLASATTPEAVTLLRSAISANSHGDYANAAHHARLAELSFARVGNFAGAARSRFEFVHVQNRLFSTSECLRSGLSLSKDLDRHSYYWLRVQLLLEIAGCQAMSTNFDRSHKTLDEAIKQAQRSQYSVLQLRAASFKTSGRRMEGQLNTFWTEIQKELAIFWSGSFYPLARGYQLYGDLEFAAEEAGEWQLAEALQREALSLIQENPREDVKAYAHFRLAAAAEMAGDLSLAKEEFKVAHSTFQQLPATEATRRLQADAAIALAAIQARQGEVAPAKQLLKEAAPQVENIDYFLPQLNFSLASAEVARSEQNWQLERSYLGEAARIGNAGFTTIHSQQERWQWRRLIETVYKRLLEIELHAHHEPAQTMADWEVFRAAEVRGGVPASAIHSLAVKDELLRQTARLQDATLAAFVVLPESIQAWIADNRGIEEYSIPIAARNLDQKVQMFNRLCNAQSSIARQKELAADLYQLLFGPLEKKLDRQRILLIEADGPLASLSWPALLTPAGKYLGEEYSLAGTPGLFYRAADFSKSNGQKPGKILVAIPGRVTFEDQDLAPLPQAEEEAQSLNPANTVCLRGKDATLPQLTKYLPQAAIFHFAGHAIGFEHGGELVLAGDSGGNMLTAATISGLHLSGCRLVVLSACSTAFVGQDILHNPDGLVQAFLNSGAQRVIASHWDVDSGATAEFMHALYQSLDAGEGIPAALRDARKRIISNPRMAAPYYWASFEAFGWTGVDWPSPVLPNIASARDQRLALKEKLFTYRP